MNIAIEKARADDADAVCQLLESNQIPLDGLREHLDTTIVARRNREVVGVAALELTCRPGVRALIESEFF